MPVGRRRAAAVACSLVLAACANPAESSTLTLVMVPDVISFTAAQGTNPPEQTVAIAETGGRTVSNVGVDSVTYTAGQPTGWLTASMSGSTTPASLALDAATGSLAVGSYSAFVYVGSPNAANQLKLPVTFNVVASTSAVIALSKNAVLFTAVTGSGSSPAAQTVSVTNGGAGTLNVGVGTIAYGAGASGWLAASVSSSTAPATLTLTPTLGSLAAGTYTATVPVTSTNGANSPQNVSVGFVVQAVGSINANCAPYPTPTIPAPLRTFYVDATTGNDANSGTSSGSAWKTLDKANTSAQPGDLILLNGTFSGQVIHPAVSGTAGAKIVYRALSAGSARVTVGQYDVVVWLDGRSHIVVDGIEVDAVQNPILMRFNATNNWLFNMNVHDAGGSIISQSDDNRIEGSTFTRIGSEASNAGDAIFIQDGADRNIIVRNNISYAGHGTVWVSYNTAGESTANDNVITQNETSNPWASGMGLNGKAVGTIVECNRIHNTADGSGVNYPRAGIEIEGQNNIIRYNEIFRNGAYGITVQGRTFNAFLQNASGNQVYQNTFWRNGSGSIELVQRDAGTVRNNTFENNIFWNDAGFLDQSTRYTIVFDMYNVNAGNTLPPGDFGGNVVRYSIFPPNQTFALMVRSAANGGNTTYSMATAMSTLAGWSNLSSADPLFTDETTNNVILLDASPAIDAGRIITGQAYLGAAPDLGAREKK